MSAKPRAKTDPVIPANTESGQTAMITETLHFENARIAQQLYNNDPKNLQALRKSR